MKFATTTLFIVSAIGVAQGFVPQSVSQQHQQQQQYLSQQHSLTTTTTTTTSTSLNLFGGGKKDGGGAKKGPGMMDQLAMFKKAQEMAQKKNKLDQELAKMDFEGTAEDGKVIVKFKFIPTSNPMEPNPEYEAQSFEFDDAWYESASPEELSTAVQDAIKAGIEATNQAAAEKYQALQGDLLDAFGGKGNPAAPES